MAVATINLAFEDDFVKQIDLIADNASITRTRLIYNSVKMYISDRQRLQELYAYGESAAAKKSRSLEPLLFHVSRAPLKRRQC